jgi:hypothetical protein
VRNGVGCCLYPNRIADLELAIVVVHVGGVEIVMCDAFFLQVSQCVYEGLDEKDCLRLWEVHGGVVSGLYDLCE